MFDDFFDKRWDSVKKECYFYGKEEADFVPEFAGGVQAVFRGG